ncbi:esterase-like activity of phytase family protein [Gloeocapsa sp. PCC 73106]|uniref:esterase-like activity of phytase family protein n=1 Tax=Gloeocapsa sp. PCC 73106 TaxID=102232 RepID=UPI0002ACBC91|nr:esterase-like activity of phytase family protein [Gloeocapsa sp. PCC 73106]ELR99334.1 hypothetical protein GLO73106DRAFT_00031840 [Gloeocapsa sp. PCC 73106]
MRAPEGDRYPHLAKIIIILIIVILLPGCGVTPQVMAQDRLFLDLSLDFLGEYQLPPQEWENTRVGGLSGLTYDRTRGKLLAISDDRSYFAPARFYTLNININETPILEKVTVEGVTFLRNPQGETYPLGTIDAEGIALSPRQSVYISSEGVPKNNIAPFIQEYDIDTGKLQSSLRIPERYLTGIAENQGFESLTLSPNSLAPGDPFRLFTATEFSLIQDTANPPQESDPIRMMHYVINTIGEPILVAEHLYLLDPAPYDDTFKHGLSELIALEREGYFLSLERTLSLSGFGAKIFQIVIANATDTSGIVNLSGDLAGIQPIRKKLLLDLEELDLELDNLEGMTLGPRLPDGTQSLILVSDDNFKEEQVTQFLLFRFRQN